MPSVIVNAEPNAQTAANTKYVSKTTASFGMPLGTFSGTILIATNICGNCSALAGKQNTINSTAGQIIIGNGNGATTTNAALTYNSTTSTFTATNINATSELRVGGNLISTTPSQWITSGANIYYSSGNVGIGTTTTFSLLHLHKNALAQNVRIILSDNTSTASASRGLHLIKDSTNISYLWNYENTALGFATNSTQRMTIADDGNVGIGTTNPFGILHLHKNALAGEVRVILSDNTSTASMTRGFQIIKGNDNNAYLANYENKASIFSTNSTERMRIAANGNVGIGTNNPTNKLHIVHSSTATNAEVGNISLYVYNPTNAANNNSIICTRIAGNSAGKALLSFDVENTGGWSIYTQGNNRALRINSNWQGDSNTDRIVISDDGSLSITGSLTVPVDRGMSSGDGKGRYYYINNAGSIYWGYGGDYIHQFRNGETNNNVFTILHSGELAAHFRTIASLNTDHVGVGANTSMDALGYYYLYVLHNTFTGFHRCYYEDDEIFNNDMSKEDIDIFKNNYKGRIVISTGKIKTDLTRVIPKEEGVSPPTTQNDEDEVIVEDVTHEEEPVNPSVAGNEGVYNPIPNNYEETTRDNPNKEWYSVIDKDGITIEDAIPIVQLCKVRKDKRVYGVLGSPDRSTNNKGRLIVNSVGEGAICVCNTNGNIENGDYIQSSDVLGYGEKQDDDILHNYSVAKAVMDCTFELDSPYYQCYEIENGTGVSPPSDGVKGGVVRVALIACTYHCG